MAAEVHPFAQVGGVGQVLFYLPRALRKLGIDARVFMPKYGIIEEEKYQFERLIERLKIPTGDLSNPHLISNILYLENSEVPTYFLENMEYYEWRANVYAYTDDHIRWALLCRGVLEFLRESYKRKRNSHEPWLPDIIHCNDWHTALVPNYLRTVYGKNSVLENVATVFTIHNIHYQGMFDHKNVSELDFDDGKSEIPAFFDPRLAKINYMRRGVIYADAINTVSETYAREILTPDYGEGLDGLLLELRSKLFGILNGLDYEVFDPITDSLLAANFDVLSIDRRVENKIALQKEFSLPQDEKVPMIGMVGRLDSQKGVDLAISILPQLLRDFNIQFVAVGGGDLSYKNSLEQIKKKFPEKVGIHLLPNFTLPRLVFGGADIFLMPSRFEPSGLTQLEAMRYGAVPVVRATGGLGDTVLDVDLKKEEGTGFVFKPYDPWALYGALVRALTCFEMKDIWYELVRRAMSADFSWTKSAENYLKLYRRARDFAQGKFERATLEL